MSTGGTVEGFTKEDYGADVGGYLIKDRLWFFAAYDRVTNTLRSQLPAGPQAGQVVESKSDRDLGAAKLTFNLAQNQSLIGSFFQDPRDDTGAINDNEHKLNGDPLTYLGAQKFGGHDYALRYEGIFGAAWAVSAQVARHEEQNSVGPASGAGDAIEYRDVARDFFQTGGFGLIQEKSFQRDFYGGSATRFAGNHTVKFGLEYEKESADVVKRMSGGQRVDVFARPPRPADLPPLLLDHRRRRPSTTPRSRPCSPRRSTKTPPSTPRTAGRSAPTSPSTSACAGTASRSSTPPAPSRSTSTRTTRPASASSGTRSRTATPRSSAPSGATTSSCRWTW